MKFLGRMCRDLTDVQPRVEAGHVRHHQPPVVGVAVRGGDAGVPGVGDVANGEEVGGGEDSVT